VSYPDLDPKMCCLFFLSAEAGFQYAEGLRQHMGHGSPHEPLLQTALGPLASHRM